MLKQKRHIIQILFRFVFILTSLYLGITPASGYELQSPAIVEEGIQPFHKYFQDNQVIIEPKSGNLMIKATDFVLPGKGDLDFKLERTLNLASNMVYLYWYQKDNFEIDQLYRDTTRGFYGWDLGFPWIGKINNLGCPVEDQDYNYLHINGTAIKLGLPYSGSFESMDKFSMTHINMLSDNSAIVHTKDGLIYYFNTSQKLNRIEDKYGNKIQIFYNGNRYSQMIDAAGRQIKFNYDDPKKKMTISVDYKGETKLL